MSIEVEEWVVEYLSIRGFARSSRSGWIRSARNGKCISPLSIAEAMKIAKRRGAFNMHVLEYRIRNLRTGDILPAAIL